MTRTEIKERLHRYQALKKEKEQIAQQLANLTDPRGTNWDGLPRGGGGGDPMVGIVSRRMKLRRRYERQLERLAAEQDFVEDMIADLEPTERTLMRYRYIDGLKWEEVCVAIHYGWRRTHEYHAAALDKLEEKYKETQGL